MAAGWKHCVGVSGQSLMAWGWGGSMGSPSILFPSDHSSSGQLGLGNDFDFWDPTAVSTLLLEDKVLTADKWRPVQVACGFNHSAAVIELL